MSLRVCLSVNTLPAPELGGVLWVYLNWALGLQALGCEVIWLETVDLDALTYDVPTNVAILKRRLEQHGLATSVALCSWAGQPLPNEMTEGCFDLDFAAEANLLLNVVYGLPPDIVRCFRRTALLDIDPGLLQVWLSMGQLHVAPHDRYFTIGETVGTPAARFPDCGLRWNYTPPAVFLPEWPRCRSAASAAYSTISSWWADEWVVTTNVSYDNNKRSAFLEYLNLPSQAPVQLELALCLAPDEGEDRQLLEQRGWHVRHSSEVSSTPEEYRAYIQRSRGEFSCAKPSYVHLETAWISDRTLCYLASGKPAVVQHTGPSRFLPDADGLFRFQNREEAARALATAEADYARHSRLARQLAEEYFDAQTIAGRVIERAIA
jgi:hypothetical protein